MGGNGKPDGDMSDSYNTTVAQSEYECSLTTSIIPSPYKKIWLVQENSEYVGLYLEQKCERSHNGLTTTPNKHCYRGVLGPIILDLYNLYLEVLCVIHDV